MGIPDSIVVDIRTRYENRQERFEVRMHTSGSGLRPPDDEWTYLYSTEDERDAALFRAQILVYEAVVRGAYHGP